MASTMPDSPKKVAADRQRGQPPTSRGSQLTKSLTKSKDYGSEGVTDNDIFLLPGSDYQILGVLIVLACIVRFFRIYQPSSVVFDEVHFGGFASKYIKGKFFMDVHPPLAKLLITLAGWLAGFDGEFDFKDIGKDYLEPGVPYVVMRMLPAVLGVLTIPTMFLTLKALGCRTMTATMGSALLIFENGLVTQSRLVLLDSPLIICTAFTALAFTCFTNQHELGPSNAFSASWWGWLVATGLGLGATVSVKWVGLFTIAWVGSLTLLHLWVLLGDTNTVTPRLWFKHFFARVFCLVVIPIAFYVGMFGIHFICLVNPGDGDGFMSSEFQATLNTKSMQDVPADVAFGASISLRHHNTQGGYLHSHAHMYPGGSKQQQITLYPHKDENNVWIAENQTQPVTAENVTIPGPQAWADLKPEWIKNGDVIKLYHITTHRRLHSHDVRPPVTEADWQNEVSAYGYEGFEGDANDLFRVEIIPSMSDGAEAKSRLRTIQSKFKLVHVMTGCVLFSHKVKLPDWGYEQQEVTCARGGTLPNSVWYVEGNTHPGLEENAEKVNYRNPGFLGKFWELQRVMWTTNAGLVESHAWDSRPPSWPVLRRGINFWGKDHRQVYLMGNPAIWWASTIAVAVYMAFKGLAVLRWQRGFTDYENVTFKRFDYEIGQTILGWGFHYFPFYLMARQLFLHHYFPALYFAIMALCQIYDYVFHRSTVLGVHDKPEISGAIIAMYLAFSIAVFSFFAPLTYGNPWTQEQCKAVKLFDTWDFDCNNFHDDYSKYSTSVDWNSGSGAVSSSAAPAAAEPQAPEAAVSQKEDGNPNVTPQAPAPPPGDQQVIGREERVEYRDQNGNLLNSEQVSQLEKEGKVTFKTKYETRTRLVDAAGNEIEDGPVAPEHPDAEGQNPDTQGVGEVQANSAPAQAPVGGSDVNKEGDGKPKPASDASAATKE
ncbi:MAG: hypothetical protein Q9227_001070 [Pyrenula ochraceoflavens]